MEQRRVEVIGGGPAGLFAARLIKDQVPGVRVRVSERSVPDETFGFGVAFTARTLHAVAEAQRPTFEAIVAASVPMPNQEMLVGGVSARARGNEGGLAIARSHLLAILLDQARGAGVEVELGVERTLKDVADADLVIAADGVGSRVRGELEGELGGTAVPGRGVFMWVGCAGRLPANLFAPVFTEHGMFTIHGYPYAHDRSTLGVETDVQTWRRAGMDASTTRTGPAQTDAYSLGYLQEAFADVLGGAELIGNRSQWMHFRTVSLPRWHHGNVVLIGDAAHTAHYSVGSGTKMALEDAIALAGVLSSEPEAPLGPLLDRYERQRRPRVEALQDTAIRSQHWWDSLRHRVHLPPPQLMLAYLSRGGVVSAARLASGDPDLLRAGLASFAGRPPTEAELADPTSFALAQAGQRRQDYREADGAVEAVAALRARQAGGAIVAVLGRCGVRDPWGEAADAVLARCAQLRAAGADGVRLDGGPDRSGLLDTLALAERIRLQTALLTVVGGPADLLDDLADGLIAGRADLVATSPASPASTTS